MIQLIVDKIFASAKMLFVTLCFFATTIAAYADNVEFTVNAPRAVEVGERFRIQFSVNAKGSNFELGETGGMSILSGPNQSSSSSIQIVNGNMSKSVATTYTCIMVANSAGIYTIAPASVVVDGKQYKTQEYKIEVVGSGQPSAQQPQTSPNQQQTSQPQTVDAGGQNADMFTAITVDKKSLYQGQYMVATIKIYTKKEIYNFSDIKFPAFNGFWSYDLEAPTQISLQRENVNGQIYTTGLIKRVLLMPQRSGELTIEPFEVTLISRTRVRSNNPFDDFFGGSYQNVENKVVSKPVKINVLPLPAGKPADFSGGVGNLNMKASVDKQQVKANEAVTLKVVISGQGNLKFINKPKIDFPPDVDVYDPKISQNIKNSESGQSGSVQFNYLFIPRYAGQYRIAPITFSYFDTKTKTYKTVKTSEFVIDVERGNAADEANSGVVQALTKEDVKFIGKDIRFIKPVEKVTAKQRVMYGTSSFYACYIVPLLIFIAIVLFRMAQIKQNANQAAVRNRKANKVSKKRLRVAAKYMKDNKENEFYDEILRAIWGYLSDKLSIPFASLSKDNVSGILETHSVDSQTIADLMELLNACEFAKYAPSAVQGGMKQIYQKTDDVISALDQKVK